MRRAPRHARTRHARRRPFGPALPAVRTMWGVVRRYRAVPLSAERRRARLVVTVAVLVAAVVLITRFPLASLLSQRAAISSASRQLAVVQADNHTLTRQATQLANPATVDGIARQDFGFVARGQKAYEVLPPPSGSQSSVSVSAGHVPLEAPPVAPGSPRSAALLGAPALVTNAPAGPARATGTAGPNPATDVPPRGYWGRVLRSLEFWR